MSKSWAVACTSTAGAQHCVVTSARGREPARGWAGALGTWPPVNPLTPVRSPLRAGAQPRAQELSVSPRSQLNCLGSPGSWRCRPVARPAPSGHAPAPRSRGSRLSPQVAFISELPRRACRSSPRSRAVPAAPGLSSRDLTGKLRCCPASRVPWSLGFAERVWLPRRLSPRAESAECRDRECAGRHQLWVARDCLL